MAGPCVCALAFSGRLAVRRTESASLHRAGGPFTRLKWGAGSGWGPPHWASVLFPFACNANIGDGVGGRAHLMIVLFIKARLEHIARFSLPPGYTYTLTVKDSTGEDTRKGVQVTSEHEEDLPGSKGRANFALKWVRDSKHVAHLNVVEVPKELKCKSREKVAGCYTADDEGQFVGVVGFECRGLDVIDWEPQDGFRVESTSGTAFEDVDLSEREWMDYDEKLGESIGIYDLEWKLQAVKL